MQPVNKIPCDQDEPDEATRRYCALLAAAMMLKSMRGTFCAASFLAENDVDVEQAVVVLGLR